MLAPQTEAVGDGEGLALIDICIRHQWLRGYVLAKCLTRARERMGIETASWISLIKEGSAMREMVPVTITVRGVWVAGFDKGHDRGCLMADLVQRTRQPRVGLCYSAKYQEQPNKIYACLMYALTC